MSCIKCAGEGSSVKNDHKRLFPEHYGLFQLIVEVHLFSYHLYKGRRLVVKGVKILLK